MIRSSVPCFSLALPVQEVAAEVVRVLCQSVLFNARFQPPCPRSCRSQETFTQLFQLQSAQLSDKCTPKIVQPSPCESVIDERIAKLVNLVPELLVGSADPPRRSIVLHQTS
jgi:hypothetical protein